MYHLYLLTVRLAGSSDPQSGRVEMFVNGAWGTVCDDQWDINEANIICRNLGYGHATAAPTSAAFGEGKGPIYLDELVCTEDHDVLFQCPHDSDTTDCSHNEDAGVVCSNATDGKKHIKKRKSAFRGQ